MLRESDIELFTEGSLRNCSKEDRERMTLVFDGIIDRMKGSFKYGIARNTRHDIGIENEKYQLVTFFSFDQILLNSDIDNGVDVGIRDGVITFLQYRTPYMTNIGERDLKNEVSVIFIDRDSGDLLIDEILSASTVKEQEEILKDTYHREVVRSVNSHEYSVWVDELKKIGHPEPAVNNGIRSELDSRIRDIEENCRDRDELVSVFRGATVNINILDAKYGVFPNSTEAEGLLEFLRLYEEISKRSSYRIESIEKIGEDLYSFDFRYRDSVSGKFRYDDKHKKYYIYDSFNVFNDRGETVAEHISKADAEEKAGKYIKTPMMEAR